MIPQSAKAKGRKLVVEIRDALLKHFPQLQQDDLLVKSTSMPGCDLHLSPAAQKLFPFGIEAKCVEKFSINSSWKQATSNATDAGLKPIIITRRNRGETLCVLRFNDLLEVLNG